MHTEQNEETNSPADPTLKTILLVDDDPDLRSLTRTFLEHEGYQVLSCGDADRAVQIFRSAASDSLTIDLLVTDFYMPRRTGMDLALELKRIQDTLPVILISGGFLDPAALELLRGRGWSFVRKPFAVPDLLSAVHQILAVPSPV